MDDDIMASVTSPSVLPRVDSKGSLIAAQVESVMAQASFHIHLNHMEEVEDKRRSTIRDETKLRPESTVPPRRPSRVVDADDGKEQNDDDLLSDLRKLQRKSVVHDEPLFIQPGSGEKEQSPGDHSGLVSTSSPNSPVIEIAAGLTGKNRFRAITRKIMTNLSWTRSMQIKLEDEISDQFVVPGDGSKKEEQIVFDVNVFKTVNRSQGGLASKPKVILQKHARERTDEELVVLKDVVDRLKCFSKYPRGVKQELARIIFYECFQAGRVVIQQGHVGISFYFIVSGSVTVKVSAVDKETGFTHNTILGELNEGSSFGELALLHNIKRTATIICKSDSEFLRVDKDDFESVLRTCYEREYSERLRALSWIPQTRNWSSEELRNCNNNCRMKEYLAETTICGDTPTPPDNVSFIITGQCRLVRAITLVHETGSYGSEHRYHLPKEGSVYPQKVTKLGRASNLTLEQHYWNIGILDRGYYFGTGEDLTDTFVVCKTRVEILEVPRMQFFRSNQLSVLEKMRIDLNAAIPNNKKLFRIYFQEARWSHYKDEVVKEIINKRSIPNHTSLRDVPYSIRNECLMLGQAVPEPPVLKYT